MKKIAFIVLSLVGIVCLLNLAACSDEPNNSNAPKLIFKFAFDSTQVRLNNLGQAAVMPADHAAQSPKFNAISAHYVELAPAAFTALGMGAVLFKNAETNSGGSTAIDFEKSTVVGEGETFLSLPISDIAPGTYPYLRVSLAYQNYDIKVRAMGTSITGTLASFIGYNTFIKSHTVKAQTLAVNGNRAQGYWAFETPFTLNDGQAPAGATTVPNPLFASSPIPQGSCIVTGNFEQALQITGNETEDIVVNVSLSTNNSFEWKEQGGLPNTFDPLDGDVPTDMGIRGLIGKIEP
jgi:hypothetical protein